jgi:hypothetical protein
MKSLLLSALLALTPFIPEPAHALVEEPLWQCGIAFDARGYDVKALFIGKTKIEGEGTLRCVDILGNVESWKIGVRIYSPALKPRLSLMPWVRVNGAASGIGLATNPADLFDIYHVVDVRAAAIVGGGASASVQGSRNGFTFNLALDFTRGLGVAAGASSLEIYPLYLKQ